MASKRHLLSYTAQQVEKMMEYQPQWLIENLVPAEALVDLSAPPKQGKTTYTLHMTRALLEGVPFIGCKARRTKVVYLTEQSPRTFLTQMSNCGLKGRGNDFQIVFWRDVYGWPWEAVVREVGGLCKLIGSEVLFIDTFPQFAGLLHDQENSSGAILEALRPLQAIRDKLHLSIHLSRHDRKGGAVELVDAGRGSSAYAGAMDVVYGLQKEPGRPSERNRFTRILRSAGRFDSIPDELHLSLENGEYKAHVAPGQTFAHQQTKQSLLDLMSTGKDFTIEELEFLIEVSRTEIQRVLGELGEQITCSGDGRRGSPYRYCLAHSAQNL